MKLFYHIHPYACEGEFLKRSNDKSIIFENDYIESSFLELSFGGHFVTNDLKNTLENAGFPELSFVKVDSLRYPKHLESVFLKYDETSFWKINIPSKGKVLDFFHWEERFLVVSNRALKILMNNYGFEDMIGGQLYGKEYEILTNRFFIGNRNIDFYFENVFPNENAIVKKKMKIITNEERKRRGVPPI